MSLPQHPSLREGSATFPVGGRISMGRRPADGPFALTSRDPAGGRPGGGRHSDPSSKVSRGKPINPWNATNHSQKTYNYDDLVA